MTVTGEEEDDRCGKPYRRSTITKKTKKTTKDTVKMKEFGDGMKEKKVLRRREDGKNEGENEEEDGVDMNDDDFRGLGRGEIDGRREVVPRRFPAKKDISDNSIS